MRTLIYSPTPEGHYVEYLHHLYLHALADVENEYVFICHPHYLTLRWKNCNNIKMVAMSDKEIVCDSEGSLLKRAYKITQQLRIWCKQYDIDRIWLLGLMNVMPFVAFCLPRKVKVTGIIYRIYFYSETKPSLLRTMMEKVRYSLLAISSSISKVMILNSETATIKLRKMFHSDKFCFLPDPVPSINDTNVKDVRHELGIDISKKIFLHFGAMTERKGTLEILDAISLLSEEKLSDKVFLFAGKVNGDIKTQFYNKLDTLKTKANIKVFDEFCSFEFLFNLCYTCDVILIPYKEVMQSSGVIGYASHFRKPVIGPSAGLIGELIKQYHLGITIKQVSAKLVADAIVKEFPDAKIDYAQGHTVENFIDEYTR